MILIISALFPPEPVVSAMLSLDLYNALKELGEEVVVIHPRPTRPLGFIPEEAATSNMGVREKTLHSYVCPESSVLGRIFESYSFGKASRKYIKKHKNIISCIYANSWPIFSQKAIVKASKRYGIPCIIHVQDVYPESFSNKISGIARNIINSLILPVDKYILDNCTKIVAISEKMKTYLSKSRGINAEKISVVINWQDEQEFLEYQQNIGNIYENRLFTFMYMGNIGPVAGVDLLIDAFLKADLENARLVIAGSGSMKEKMREQSASYKKIEFWDVPNGKVPEIQSQADCMLLPIKKGAARSSIPSKLPAYMFSAKPIIGCVDADSDTANAIDKADCGWRLEPERIDLLAEKMRMVSTIETSILKKKGQNALRYGIDHFSKAANLSKLVSVIESVC